jgi:hypothetical protein
MTTNTPTEKTKPPTWHCMIPKKYLTINRLDETASNQQQQKEISIDNKLAGTSSSRVPQTNIIKYVREKCRLCTGASASLLQNQVCITNNSIFV